MSAFSLAAVGSLDGQSGVALSADFLIAVELFSDGSDGGIHNTTSKSQNQVKGRFFLDVVVGQASAV